MRACTGRRGACGVPVMARSCGNALFAASAFARVPVPHPGAEFVLAHVRPFGGLGEGNQTVLDKGKNHVQALGKALLAAQNEALRLRFREKVSHCHGFT